MNARSTTKGRPLAIAMLGALAFAATSRAAAPIEVRIELVADSATVMPGGPGAFSVFGVPATDGSDVVFVGLRPGLQGVYRWRNGTLARIGDTTQVAPGAGEVFASFRSPDVVGGSVYFAASTASSPGGVYRSASGALTAIVDGSQPLQGQSAPAGLFFLSADGPAVVATKSSTPGAIYQVLPGPLTTLAIDGDPIPGGGVLELTGVSAPATDGVDTVFMAQAAGTGEPRVLLSRAGTLTVIAAPGTAVAGGPVAELSLTSTPIVDAGRVFFVAKPLNLPYGLYRWEGGVISLVERGTAISPPVDIVPLGFLANGAFASLGAGRLRIQADGIGSEPLGPGVGIAGRSVQAVDCGPESVGGNTVACRVSFQDGGAGVVRVTAELPGAGGGGGGGGAVGVELLGVLWALALWRRSPPAPKP